MDVHVRVRKRGEPTAVELDAGRSSLAAHPARCLEDDIVRQHLRESVDVVGVEGLRPLLERLARGHRHGHPPSIDEPARPDRCIRAVLRRHTSMVPRMKNDRKKRSRGFTDAERAAMKERAQELEAAARRGPRAAKADGERDVLAKIAEMSEPDRAMAERLHAIVKASAPSLSPKTWYGMPAYAKDGKVVCFFQGAQKVNSRYATLGFNDAAKLDQGAMWPTSFALKELTAAEEAKIRTLVKKAAR